ncbi:hypothetical protein [Methylobacterium sp. JK268]
MAGTMRVRLGRPAVEPKAMILSVLNGMRHIGARLRRRRALIQVFVSAVRSMLNRDPRQRKMLGTEWPGASLLRFLSLHHVRCRIGGRSGA